MCKILTMTNMAEVKIDKKFINVVKSEVCKTSDRHGFGYALVSESGKIGGEKTTAPFQFNPSFGAGESITSDLPIVKRVRESFGHIDLKKPKSFVAHGRFSTNSISLQNTHPFVNDDMALIHNGVVQDATRGVSNLLKTDNDTEIVFRYLERGGIEAVESNVSGYYALAILDVEGQLHIVRDSQATLYVAWVRSVNSFMIATTIDIIEGVCKKMKWVFETPEMILDNIYVVFNGNEIVSTQEINPIGHTGRMDKTSKTALGLRSTEEEEDDTELNWSYKDLSEAEKDYYKEYYSRESNVDVPSLDEYLEERKKEMDADKYNTLRFG